MNKKIRLHIRYGLLLCLMPSHITQGAQAGNENSLFDAPDLFTHAAMTSTLTVDQPNIFSLDTSIDNFNPPPLLGIAAGGKDNAPKEIQKNSHPVPDELPIEQKEEAAPEHYWEPSPYPNFNPTDQEVQHGAPLLMGKGAQLPHALPIGKKNPPLSDKQLLNTFNPTFHATDEEVYDQIQRVAEQRKQEEEHFNDVLIKIDAAVYDYTQHQIQKNQEELKEKDEWLQYNAEQHKKTLQKESIKEVQRIKQKEQLHKKKLAQQKVAFLAEQEEKEEELARFSEQTKKDLAIKKQAFNKKVEKAIIAEKTHFANQINAIHTKAMQEQAVHKKRLKEIEDKKRLIYKNSNRLTQKKLPCSNKAARSWFEAACRGNTVHLRYLYGQYTIHIDMPDRTSEYGPTALCWAVYTKKVHAVQLLLQMGANVNICSQATILPPLHYACYLTEQALIDLLIANGANPYLKITKEKNIYDLASLDAKKLLQKALQKKNTPKKTPRKCAFFQM